MRIIAIEDLGHMTETCFREMTRKHLEPLTNLYLCLLAADLSLRVDERAEKPGPDWSLMIRTVPGHSVSHITSSIPCVRRRQAADAVRSKQLALDGLHHRPGPLFAQHRVRQACRKNLIRPHCS